jgi:hypothetical protein
LRLHNRKLVQELLRIHRLVQELLRIHRMVQVLLRIHRMELGCSLALVPSTSKPCVHASELADLRDHRRMVLQQRHHSYPCERGVERADLVGHRTMELAHSSGLELELVHKLELLERSKHSSARGALRASLLGRRKMPLQTILTTQQLRMPSTPNVP